MGTNRRKAVRDRKKHRADVEKWKQKRREKRAKEVANRLLGVQPTFDHTRQYFDPVSGRRWYSDRYGYGRYCMDHAPTT